MNGKRIIIVAGHYGAGKTNVAVSLALAHAESGSVIVDLDTVNPYFRAADSGDALRAAGVRTLFPEFANSNVDIPTLPSEIASVFLSEETVVFDVGGDDGASALGVYQRDLESAGYEMLYVVNMYRPLIADPVDAVANMREIELYSRLRFTGIVNNSNLGAETTRETVADSVGYAARISELSGLPLIFTSVIGGIRAPRGIGEVLIMDDHTKKLF